MPDGPLDRVLRDDGVLLLDGGLGTELERRGSDLSDPLWSARLLATEPEAIIGAHLAYFRAGAQVATTASYQATFEGFSAAGIESAEAARLIGLSVELAAEARRRYLDESRDDETRGDQSRSTASDLLVAASIGPYGAMLADGSEYRGDYGLSVGQLCDFHRRRFEVLASSAADLLAFETIPSVDEGHALATLLEEAPDARAWLSFSCADGGHTRRGDPIEEAFDLANETRGVVAIGVNCTEPRFVVELIERAASRTGKPVMAYPNGGERWNANGRNWFGTGAERLSGDVAAWIQAGARIVGGCCRVGPETIAEMATILHG
jgi:homocysteine S-methyltransferase